MKIFVYVINIENLNLYSHDFMFFCCESIKLTYESDSHIKHLKIVLGPNLCISVFKSFIITNELLFFLLANLSNIG